MANQEFGLNEHGDILPIYRPLHLNIDALQIGIDRVIYNMV